MTKTQSVKWITLAMCLASSFPSLAEMKETIVINAKGDYEFTYESHIGWQKVAWVPATKIHPTIRSDVRQHDKELGSLRYRYTIQNGRGSQQYIVGMSFRASHVLSLESVKPTGWAGGAVPDHTGKYGYIVGWFYQRFDGPWEAGIKPGAVQNGFGIDARDLPGVGNVAIRGATPPGQSFPDEGPSFESAIYSEFNRIINNDFVPRLVAVPRIAVPDPYDTASVLTNIQKHLDTDLVGMKLIDPLLVNQLDSWFATAIDAARRNNAAGLSHAIKELRQLLKQQYADLEEEVDKDDDDKRVGSSRLARLAAKVLDFDLRYVEKKIGR